jgi:hypothetical protein
LNRGELSSRRGDARGVGLQRGQRQLGLAEYGFCVRARAAARLEPYAWDFNIPVTHSSNAIDAVGNCHHFGKSCRRESLGLNLVKGNRPIGGIWKTTYPLDQVGRPEVAIRGWNGITINNIITITPWIYKFQRRNFAHKQVSFRFFQNCNRAWASKIFGHLFLRVRPGAQQASLMILNQGDCYERKHFQTRRCVALPLLGRRRALPSQHRAGQPTLSRKFSSACLRRRGTARQRRRAGAYAGRVGARVDRSAPARVQRRAHPQRRAVPALAHVRPGRQADQ